MDNDSLVEKDQTLIFGPFKHYLDSADVPPAILLDQIEYFKENNNNNNKEETLSANNNNNDDYNFHLNFNVIVFMWITKHSA